MIRGVRWGSHRGIYHRVTLFSRKDKIWVGMYQFGLVLIPLLLGTITRVVLIHMYGYLGVAWTLLIIGFMEWIVWAESQYTTNTIAKKANYHTIQILTRTGHLKLGGHCRIMEELNDIERAIKSILVHISPMGETSFDEHWKPKFDKVRSCIVESKSCCSKCNCIVIGTTPTGSKQCKCCLNEWWEQKKPEL